MTSSGLPSPMKATHQKKDESPVMKVSRDGVMGTGGTNKSAGISNEGVEVGAFKKQTSSSKPIKEQRKVNAGISSVGRRSGTSSLAET